MPPAAASNAPIRGVGRAGERAGLVAEQLGLEQAAPGSRRSRRRRTARRARALSSWIASAARSLPVPLSPCEQHGRVWRAAARLEQRERGAHRDRAADAAGRTARAATAGSRRRACRCRSAAACGRARAARRRAAAPRAPARDRRTCRCGCRGRARTARRRRSGSRSGTSTSRRRRSRSRRAGRHRSPCARRRTRGRAPRRSPAVIVSRHSRTTTRGAARTGQGLGGRGSSSIERLSRRGVLSCR